jgi:hypothetical protein
MELNKWTFWWLLLGYSVISFILFVHSTAGWDVKGGFGGFFQFYGFSFIYLSLIIVVLIINIKSTFNKRDIRPQLSWIFLLVLLTIQITALLTNTAYCGDGSFKYRFYELLVNSLSSWDYCPNSPELLESGTNFRNTPQLPFGFEGYILIYIILLFIFNIKAYCIKNNSL